jgi:predicted nuclease of restriction endonuclease-like (RecB) superfamily
MMHKDINTIVEPIMPLVAQMDAANPESVVTTYHALGSHLTRISANTPSPATLKAVAHAIKEIHPAKQVIGINTLKSIYRFAKEYKTEELTQKKLILIPWSHHTVLLHTVQDQQARLFYCEAILKHRWSRAALIRNIQSNLYERHARVVTNFSTTLPRTYAQQAHMAFKQSYLFTIAEEVTTERDIEDALMKRITDFLKELGPGFAFIGRQYHIHTIGDDCYIDLLMYHTLLRCYVVIELKNGPLKPEYAGKMHFYMQAVDAALKTIHDNQTIGLILCKSTSPATIATLYDAAKPMVVAEYQLKNITEKQDKKNATPTSKPWLNVMIPIIMCVAIMGALFFFLKLFNKDIILR